MKAGQDLAHELPGESPHYIRSVTEMGNTREVIVSADIFASNGIKLLAKGARVDSLQYERLTHHRLSAPLDSMLATQRPVDGNYLALEVDRIVEHDATCRRIVTRAGDPHLLKHGQAGLALPPPVQPRTSAALSMFIPSPAMSCCMRCRASPPPAAAKAILQHHERLDGSGYPHALSADHIGTLGKLLGVADVAEAAIKRFALHRVEMLFRINRARFAPAMLDALRDLLHVTAQDEHGLPDEDGTAAQLSHLGDQLHAWFNLRAMLEGQPAPKDGAEGPLAFLFERMAQIRSLVLQAGMDPDHMCGMLAMTQDAPELQLELHAMLDEMDWLLRDLANEIDRRSPELTGLSQGALKDWQDRLRHPESPARH